MGQKDRFYVDIMALQPEVTGSCNLVIVKYPNGTSTKFIPPLKITLQFQAVDILETTSILICKRC